MDRVGQDQSEGLGGSGRSRKWPHWKLRTPGDKTRDKRETMHALITEIEYYSSSSRQYQHPCPCEITHFNHFTLIQHEVIYIIQSSL